MLSGKEVAFEWACEGFMAKGLRPLGGKETSSSGVIPQRMPGRTFPSLRVLLSLSLY